MRKVVYAGVIALLVTAALSSEARPATVAEALPQDVIVFIDIPNLPALRMLDKDTAFGRIMAEEEVKAFLEKGFPALSQLDESWTAITGKNLGAIVDYGTGEATVALLGQPGQASAVIVLEVGENAQEAREFVDTSAARLMPSWQEEEIPGAKVKYFQAGPFATPSYSFVGKYLVISSSVEYLKDVAAGIQSGRKQSFAEDELFNKVKALAGEGQPEIVAYLNMARVTDLLAERMPPAVAEGYRQSGLGNLSAALYTSRPVGEGFVDKMLLYFPDGRAGFFEALTPESGEYEKHLEMVPADVINASWTHIDFAALYETARQVASTVWGPEALARFDGRLAEIEAETGIKAREDLVGGLGRNVVSYTPRPSMIMGMALTGGLGQGITMVELADEAAFEKGLAAFWSKAQAAQPAGPSMESTGAEAAEAAGAAGSAPGPFGENVTFSTEPFGNKTIYVMRVNVTIKESIPLQLSPSMAVDKGRLVVAMTSQGVKNALSMPLVPEKNLATNTDYANAAKVAGTANAGFHYTDTKAAFEMVYSLAGIGLPIVMMQLGGAAPVDQTMLPQAQVISQHLFGSASAVNVTDDTVEMTSYGPVGQTRALYLAGSGAAALGTWFANQQRTQPPAQQEGAVDEEAVESELTNVGMGLFRWARAHDGAFPPDLETLKAEGLLDDEMGDVDVDPADYVYVPGLTLKDDRRLILVFARTAGPSGRGVLLANMNVMNLADDEVADQAGGWLDLPADASTEQRSAACEKNLKVLADAVKRYAEMRDGKTPERLGHDVHYTFAPLLLACPADTDKKGADYGVVGGLDVKAVPAEQAGAALLVYETKPFSGGKHAAAFLDGSVKQLTDAELESAIEATKAMSGAAK